MFTQIQSGARQPEYGRAAFLVSAGLHCLFLLWLLHVPTPRVVERHAKTAKSVKRDLPRPKLGTDAETTTPGQAAQVQAAGSPLGTVLEGPLAGEEVRPALPVVSPDPAVAAVELNGLQGDVVVEVTIDEKGNIVQKVVIQSLAPAIDGKVLEALENWRFRPATRNGVAIPSKQDVYYHFPRFGKG